MTSSNPATEKASARQGAGVASQFAQPNRPKPRLLQLTTVAQTFKAFLLPFADHFRARGWHVAAGCGDIESARDLLGARFDALHPIPWARTLAARKNYTDAIRELQRVVREGRYDLVHVHTPIAAFLTRFALRNMRHRTKVIYTAHGFHFGCSSKPVFLSPFFHAEKIAGRWTDALAVINQVDLRNARAHRLCAGGTIYHTPGIGVDVAQFAARLGEANPRLRKRSELGVSDQEFLLLMIAEFNPGKRHLDLFEAVKRLQGQPLRLFLAGDGREFAKHQEIARNMGISDRVHFLGFRPDIPDLIQAADATTLPSAREGLPRSIMESMALGVPVIGSRIRGIDELLAEGAGLLFELGNVDQFTACIRQFITDPASRQACARAGLLRVRNYGIARVLDCYEQIYGDLLAQLRPFQP